MTDKGGDKLQARLGMELRGKWTLERLIGEGGMAAVYVGVHRIGRRDAIKILHAHVASDPELRARFEQEAHAVNRFSHPGAVEIRDIDVTDDGAPFLVMELLEGESLAARGSRGPIAVQELLGYVDQLLDVLVKAHAEGIVHRDIKPDNLFVSADGRLKVLDFGIARVRDGSFGRQMATRAGIALGTVAYMPPEQLSGVGVDHRADLFATGATLLRLLTGRRIHESSSHSELLVRMATVPAPKVSSVCPEVDPDVAAVIDRSLAYDKLQRYADAATMQADIRALLRGERPQFTGPPAASPLSLPTTIERSPLPPTVGGGAGAAAALSLPTVAAPAPGAASTVSAPMPVLQEPTTAYGPPTSEGPSSLAPVVASAFPAPHAISAPTSYEGSPSAVIATLPLPAPAVRPADPAAILPTVLSARPASVPPVNAAAAANGEPAKSDHGIFAMVAVGLASLALFLTIFLILGYVVFGRAPSTTTTPPTIDGDSGGLGGDRKPPIATSPPANTPPPKSDPGDKDRDKDRDKDKKKKK